MNEIHEIETIGQELIELKILQSKLSKKKKYLRSLFMNLLKTILPSSFQMDGLSLKILYVIRVLVTRKL